MRRLSFINFSTQYKQSNSMPQSRISKTKVMIPAHLRLIATMSQSNYRFYVHNIDPKTNYEHKVSNKSLRSHPTQIQFLLVLSTLITKLMWQKINLQLSIMTFSQGINNLRPSYADFTN